MSSTRDDSSRARLLQRAELLASVQHPNLVRLLHSPSGLSHELGGAQRLSHFTGSHAPFRRFELEHAVQLLLDVLNGLGALHELVFERRAFVHGAVSPHHIYIDGYGQARLAPLVRAHFEPGVAIEMSGYAAPEWLLGSEIDRRADLFSVGVLLWEALANRRLFSDPSAAAVLARLASGALPRPALPRGADWARALCLVAERAVAADPGERYGSARELSSAIVAAGGPRLTRPLSDKWQDEAPTLPPQARPEPRRTLTPPGVAIDLAPMVQPSPEPEPPASEPEPPASQPTPLPQLRPEPAGSSRPGPSRALGLPTRPALRPWLLAATAAGYLALVWWVQGQTQPSSSAAASAHVTVAAAPAPLPPTSTLEVPMRPPLTAPGASATSVPSARPVVSAPPSTSAPGRPGRRRPKARAADVDYGI